MAAAGFLSHYLSGSLPYVFRVSSISSVYLWSLTICQKSHIVNFKNVLNASLNDFAFLHFNQMWDANLVPTGPNHLERL